ncbi:MAG: O-antigen ligase family protein, partial [Actinomycetota bacterium]|nr:O-antigen ligase family protein [Actinomycetota bacterium]
DAAVQDFERAMLYATVFALGLWLANLSGRRMLIPLAVVALVGGLVGIVTTLTLALGTDVPSYFHGDATLRYPVGYRNAEAAFLLICLWPMVVLAAEAKVQWHARALAVGAGTMLLELAVLAESRGSLPASLVALAALILLSPRRLRIAGYLVLAALPVLPALPTLLDVFKHGGDGPDLIPLMRDSAHAIALTSLGSLALAAFWIRAVEPNFDLGPQRTRVVSRVVATAALSAVLIGGTVYIAHRGGPFKFLDQRVQQFKSQGEPNLHSAGTRFGFNAGSNRHDFWRVALDEARDHPLAGGGAGSFAAEYLLHRHSVETPRDPHSVEMLMISELGIVGLLLLAAFLVASAISGLRTRRLGPPAAALAAGSLTVGAYWLVHASYDWLWHYPAITTPAIFLLGAAASPPLLDRGVSTIRSPARWAGVAVLAVSAVIALPLFLSQRYVNRAYDEARNDPGLAISDLNRAADLDPYDPQPQLAKGVVESRLGRDAAAVSAFRQAIGRQPDAYAGHFFLARALARSNPPVARAEAREALRLNPLDPQTQALNRALQRPAGAQSPKNGRK